MDPSTRGYSLVQDYGPYSSTCGYCKNSEETTVSHGKRSHGTYMHTGSE